MRTLSIAAIQTAPVPQDVEATWQRFAEQVEQTKALFPHVDMIVVPELLLAAPDRLLTKDPQFEERSAAPIPGRHTDRICELARAFNVWLVPGSLVECAPDGKVYNTAVAVSPQGEIVARYRKIFPWRPYEDVASGSDFVTFDIAGAGRIGLAICFDGSFPEVARQLAWLGADVIVQPTLTTTRDRDMEVVMSRANAFANQVFVVNVNASDPAGVGHSVIVDPEGTITQEAGTGEEILVAVLNLDLVDQARQFGSFGLNRPWVQLAAEGGGLTLPAYGNAPFSTPAWMLA